MLVSNTVYKNNLLMNPFEYQVIWDDLLQLIPKEREETTNSVLQDFLGTTEELPQLDFRGIHHLAFYLGDYRNDNEILLWDDFLHKQLKENCIQSIERGPSYIAPKYYGTPGWWFTLLTHDRFNIELFSCLHYSHWKERSADERVSLMSHKALKVPEDGDVLRYMNILSERKNIVSIAYTEGDSLGHTYCHIINKINSKILELLIDKNM